MVVKGLLLLMGLGLRVAPPQPERAAPAWDKEPARLKGLSPSLLLALPYTARGEGDQR